MFFCSLLFRILSRTRVIKTLAYLFYAIRPARDAYEIKAIIVIRCFAQSRQQQTDRMKDPFNPLLRIVSESGARRDRIWDETRPNLGRGTTAPGTRHERIWDEARLNAGRRSLTGIGCGLAGCLVCKPMVFAKSGRLPHHSLIVNTPKYSIAFHILLYEAPSIPSFWALE